MQPVFIMAMGRSGTTLLRLKLGALPGVVSFPESNFWSFKERCAALDLGFAKDRAVVVARLLAHHQVRQWQLDEERLREELLARATSWRAAFEILVERFIAERAADAGEVTHWCEKSPPHIFRRDAITADFPEARFIYLVRDPRGVAASMKSCRWAHNNVYAAARVWRAAVARVRDDEQSILVRYEDLAARPEHHLRRIAEFIGAPFDDRAVSGVTPDALAQRQEWIAQAMQPISAQNIDNWRQRLCYRDRELELIQHVCRREMERFGYELRSEHRDARFRTQLAVKWTELALSKLVKS